MQPPSESSDEENLDNVREENLDRLKRRCAELLLGRKITDAEPEHSEVSDEEFGGGARRRRRLRKSRSSRKSRKSRKLRKSRKSRRTQKRSHKKRSPKRK